MQLKSLYIKDYKILKDFSIDFAYDFERYISVFIGANGSGKSTVLEAIAQIFSNAYLNEKAKFGFELEYSLNLEFPVLVKLSAEKDENISISVESAIDNTDLTDNLIKETKQIILDKKRYSLFPDNVIVYYSGLSEHMDLLCKKHEEIQQKEFFKGNNLAKRSLFYYRLENFNMLLLALLSYEFGDIKDFIFDKLRITEASGFYIKIKRPNTSWAKGKKAKDLWGAKGVLKEFYLVLSNYAKFTMIADDDNSIEFSFPTIGRLYSIKNHYGNERKLFDLLDMSYYEGFFETINISFNKGIKQVSSIPQDGEIHFSSNQLSEGEQQSIIIKGLTELLAEKNTLFLFDEPDTYLHPKWQRQFISEIEKTIDIGGTTENNYVIATHSPQLLSNAKTELNFVKVIENGVFVENTPKYYGRDINAILFDLMGVEERNNIVKKNISDLFTLIEEEEIEDAENALKELQKLIGEDDIELKRAEIQIEYLKEDE